MFIIEDKIIITPNYVHFDYFDISYSLDLGIQLNLESRDSDFIISSNFINFDF